MCVLDRQIKHGAYTNTEVYDHAEKADLSKGYPKRTLGGNHALLNTIKQ